MRSMKKNDDIIEVNEKIIRYVNGRLPDDEIDELWAEIIRDEHYMNYLKTLVNLKKVIEQKDHSSIIN